MSEEERLRFAAALAEGAAAVGVPLTEAQIDLCRRHAERVRETNLHTNLTRIVAPEAMAVKHYVDSLTPLAALPDLPEGARVIDVGAGAGFPGLALKIARPAIRLTLLDSLKKRLDFLEEAIAALGLKDVACVHARAEEAGRDPAHRDRYDLAVARAVASLPTLLEWCAPLVRPGGRLVALKGGDTEAATEAPRLLRLAPLPPLCLTLPGDEGARRTLLVYAKTAPTPARFPRPPAQIRARPLA